MSDSTHYQHIADIMENGKFITRENRAMIEYRDAKTIAFDLETTGDAKTKDGLSFKRGQIAVVAFSAAGHNPVVLHYPKGSRGPSAQLIRFLERRTLIGHNITSFDVPFLCKYGFRPFVSVGWIDTLIAEQLAMVSGRRDLKKNLETSLHRRLGIQIDKNINHDHWGNEALSDTQIYYVLNDIVLLEQLWSEQQKALDKNKLWDAWNLEQTIFPIVSNMIFQGMPLDLEMLEIFAESNSSSFLTSLDDLMELIDTDAVNSPKKLRQAFIDTFGVDLVDTKANTLMTLSGKAGQIGRAAATIKNAREFKKRSMYGSKWIEKYYNNGRINSRYVQLGTDTSRFSAHDPNLQQIPSNMRDIFGYDECVGRSLVKCDYSQIEALIFGLQTKEYKIVKWYISGRDLHSEVAARLFNMSVQEIEDDKKNGGNLRKTAKAATFAMLFAGGRKSIIATARKEGIEIPYETAGNIVKQFFRNFPNAGAYIDTQRRDADLALRDNRAITLRLPSGPKRSLYGVDVTASRLVNTMVQGTASVGLKLGLVECLKSGIAQYIVAVVHDEIVLDCPSEEVHSIMPTLEMCMKVGMEKVIGIMPKVEASYGSHWSR